MDLINQIAEILADLPAVEILNDPVKSRYFERAWDAVIAISWKGQPIHLLIDVRANGYPRDVQQAIWRLQDVTGRVQQEPDGYYIPVVAAPSISGAARELLRERGISYVDGGGSIFIDLPHATYLVERPAPSVGVRSIRNIYQGSSAQVLHALLHEPGRSWHINALAERATVAQSTAYQVCRHLENQLVMDKAGKGPATVRILREPGKLLDGWAEAHELDMYAARRYHRWFRDRNQLAKHVTTAFDRAGIEYALTLSSGADLVAPYAVGTSTVWALIPSSAFGLLDDVVQDAELQPVEDGETVSLLLTDERFPLLFRRQVEGMWVANDIQLYLDLWAWPQRGRELARHLRAERIGF